MIFNISGGGGTALNFQVIAYNTEEDLLASSPIENTIGVITETPITSWTFDTEEPSVAESGMVWILTDLNSSVEFNAINKNGIQVYPISAKQYVDGSWLYKPAKIYQGGEWSDFIRYLYNLGNECTDITGGWAIRGTCTKSITKNSDNIYASFTGVSNAQTYGCLHTVNQIDLTPYSTLTVNEDINETPSSVDNYDYVFFFASPTLPSSYNTVGGTGAYINFRSGSRSIDVSALTGNHYIGFAKNLDGLTSYKTYLRLKQCELV